MGIAYPQTKNREGIWCARILYLSMAKERDDLRDLVLAMTKAEKAFFTKYAEQNGQRSAKYILLFDIMNEYPGLQDAALRKKYEQTLQEKKDTNYNYTRHYLHRLILKSLHEFHAEDSVNTQLNVWLNEVSILFNKSLYKACEKLLDRLDKLTEEKELYLITLQLIPWRRKLMNILGYANTNAKEMQLYEDREKRALQNYNVLLTLSHYTNKLVYYQKKTGTPAAKNLHSIYDEVLEHLTANKGMYEKHSGTKIKLQYYHLLSTVYFGKRQFSKAVAPIKTNIDLLLKHPFILDGEEDRLLSQFNNLLALTVDLAQWKLFEEYMKKMSAFAETKAVAAKPGLKFSVQQRALAFRMRAEVEYGNYHKAAKLKAEADALFAAHESDLAQNYRIQFRVHLAILFYLNGNNDEAYNQLRKLQYETDNTIRKDLHAYARLLELVLLDEMKDYRLMSSTVRSVERQFKLLGQASELDKLLLAFFKNSLPKAASRVERQQAFAGLSAKLEKLISEGKRSTPVVERFIRNWVSRNV